MIITDTGGNPITYIPVTVYEGEESAAQTIRITPETEEEILTVTDVPEVTVWGKIGAGAWFNFPLNPVSLEPYFGTFLDLQIKVIAEDNLPGVTRVELFLGVKTNSAAAWLS